MNEGVKKILEIITDVQEHMTIKEDLAGLERSLRSEIAENTRAIAALVYLNSSQAGLTFFV